MKKSILALLFIPGLLVACDKKNNNSDNTPSNTPTDNTPSTPSPTAADLIKEVKINLDFEEGEDSYVSDTHLAVVLPPTEGNISLSTEIKVDREESNRIVAGCTYSIVGDYNSETVSLTNNVLHLKDAVTITLKTAFTFADTNESFSKQFTVEFSLPNVHKVKMTRATLGSLSNYGLDFTSVNGFPDSVSDDESLCEMSGNGSYGYSNYAKLESISKITFEFKRMGTFSSTEVWGTKYENKGSYISAGGDVRISKNNSDTDESGILVIDFSARASDFNDAPYCFQCWFWNNSALSEESALIKSITIEYVPFVEAE